MSLVTDVIIMYYDETVVTSEIVMTNFGIILWNKGGNSGLRDVFSILPKDLVGRRIVNRIVLEPCSGVLLILNRHTHAVSQASYNIYMALCMSLACSGEGSALQCIRSHLLW